MSDTIIRADVLRSNLTTRKAGTIRATLQAYRRGAVLLGHEQWRLFFEVGSFNKYHDRDKATFKAVIGNAARVQMARWQVVGALQSWVSNRANDFRDAVNGSSLAPDVRHMLFTINRQQAWFSRKPIKMARTKAAIPSEIRRLGRSIMRGVMRRHRRPDLSHISMWLDARAVSLAAPQKARQAGAVARWATFRLNGQRFDVPLLNNPLHARRSGKLAAGVMVIEDRETRELRFGLSTDITAACEASRAAYEPAVEVLELDFGLNTLFASGEGDLLGRNWLTALKAYDVRITNIARGMQKRGLKPRQSARYRRAVSALRGWIKSEVNRVINRLIAQKRPAELALERLNFQNPELSRRLNRIIQNCGRAVIKAKLADLTDRFGIAVTESNPAYTSQTCSHPGCGYVDRRNRNGSAFRCRWCGHSMHADVNAARNIGERRALPMGSVFQTKVAVLAELVRRFGGWDRERPTGGNGSTADPRLSNSYFGRRGFDVAHVSA